MNKILYFNFQRLIKNIDINEKLRVSTWLENTDYLMPCQFTNVLPHGEEIFNITVDAIDPDNMINYEYLNKTFYFGHPGKIVGKGILNNFSNSKN